MWQCNVRTSGELDLMMTIRSWDFFLGGPFNIASYAFLAHLLASAVERPVGDLIISAGNVHIYENHLEQAREQLNRIPSVVKPQLHLAPWIHKDMITGEPKNLRNLSLGDITLMNYHPQGKLPGEAAV